MRRVAGGLVLDVPAKSNPALVDRALRQAKLGLPKLSGPGQDADPLLVLTEAALRPPSASIVRAATPTSPPPTARRRATTTAPASLGLTE